MCATKCFIISNVHDTSKSVHFEFHYKAGNKYGSVIVIEIAFYKKIS